MGTRNRRKLSTIIMKLIVIAFAMLSLGTVMATPAFLMKKDEHCTVCCAATTDAPTGAPTDAPTDAPSDAPTDAPPKPKDVTTKPADATTKPADVTTKPADVTTKPADVTTKHPCGDCECESDSASRQHIISIVA